MMGSKLVGRMCLAIGKIHSNMQKFQEHKASMTNAVITQENQKKINGKWAKGLKEITRELRVS